MQRLVESFSTVVSGIEEVGSDALPEWEVPPLDLPEPFSIPIAQDPRLWAWRKGVDALSTLPTEDAANSIALAADTVVVAPGELLNKPANDEDAIRMLTLLRGQAHYVVTGFVLLRHDNSKTKETLHTGAVVTRIVMRDFTDREIQGYVATGEHSDKAGAYALQGLGGKLVERVEGCVTNVVGLPLCAVRLALQAARVEVLSVPQGGYCGFCAHS